MRHDACGRRQVLRQLRDSGSLSTQSRNVNRLVNETSPYLLQHAHNPVDWYPWGPEALARAAALDRPIFLSIGYAACHWCHVMERESFEDETTAADLNAGFVAIKVDREERPDLDALYMDAVQALTGQGGWPMSVLLTPDGRPFYGGTYFPDQPRGGMPSFRQVLAGVREAWAKRRPEVEASASQLAEAIARGQQAPAPTFPTGGGAGTPEAGADSGAAGDLAATAVIALNAATEVLVRSFDMRTGGWGGSPRFPQPMALELLLREHLRNGDPRPLEVVRRALDAMAAGGIHDQLGGGFARYATDSVWLVPHFEKMLYDNAQLARVYLHAWQVTADPAYAEVVRTTLDFAARELRVVGAAFAASLDADTDGEEGATYVWSAAEVAHVLGPDAPLFMSAYGVTSNGNWEGSTILTRASDDATLATRFGVAGERVAAQLAQARARLLLVRDARPQPVRDDKVLASWNGLLLAALAEAGRALPDGERFTLLATEAATFLWTRLVGPDGRLRRSWKDQRTGPAAVLEDHTHLADGMLALYETTFEERWFGASRELMETALRHFTDPAGGFFDTADDAETLIARPRSLQDNAIPSGNAMAATVLLRLAGLTGDARYLAAAERTVAALLPLAARHPTGFAQWLVAAGLLAHPVDEVAIVGDPSDAETMALLAVVRRGYRPWQVVAVRDEPDASSVPLLWERGRIDERVTAYVCRGFTCRLPVTGPDALAAQLAQQPVGS